jgi:hypothetical protein
MKERVERRQRLGATALDGSRACWSRRPPSSAFHRVTELGEFLVGAAVMAALGRHAPIWPLFYNGGMVRMRRIPDARRQDVDVFTMTAVALAGDRNAVLAQIRACVVNPV